MSNPFAGIECPKCGSIDLRVLETRRQKSSVLRRRECDRRHDFYTVELLADADGLPSTTAEDAFSPEEGAALLWLGAVRDDFRRMADEASRLLEMRAAECSLLSNQARST